MKLPRLGIGCGSVALGAPQEMFRELIISAAADGQCLLDTAPLYDFGQSERRLGEALSGISREALILSTKVGRYPLDQGAPGLGSPSRFDYTYDETMRSVENSLQLMGCETLDMVFVHDLDGKKLGESYQERRTECLAGAIPALRELQAQGMIGKVGVASMEWQACLDIVKVGELDIVLLAGGATLLDRASDPLFEHCRGQNTPIIVGAPFNSGILATGAIDGARYNYDPAPSHILERVRAMQNACDKYGIPLVAAALQYPARRHSINSLLVGHSTITEYRTNQSHLNLNIPAELWAELEAI